jgi:FMN phosphatase YigB (HAD superfamily)
MPIQAVIFDLGKVLLDFDYTIAARKFLPRCRAPLPVIVHLINQSPLLHRLETGLVTSQAFFDEMQAATGFQGSWDEFRTMFGDIFSPIQPMVRLHAELRALPMRTYVFSNTNDLAVAHIRDHFPFFRQFDGYVYSYEHHAMKPESILYEIMEKTSGCQGAELLYLDDRPENIAAGAARGWRTVVHETPEKTRTAIVQMGLLK